MKYEKKILVIPDIHTHHEKADRIISKYKKTHKFVFIGDYFDQFSDTPESNSATAQWLKNTMNELPDSVFLYGNHDVHYHPSFSVICSGFSTQKKTAINEVLTIDDWNKLKYFHFENGWWFSHAGLTMEWFANPITGEITVEDTQKIIDDAVIKLINGDNNNAIWAASYARGGRNKVGSITWCDWRELPLIPNTKQVVGHTPIKKLQTITDNIMNSSIVNVDTSASMVYMTELLEIDENGHTNVIDTSYV